MPRVVKSRDEIFSRWGYCDNHDLSRLDNQSIERDRLIGIGFVLNFVKFISFTFGDKEMISVIEAIIREVFVKLLLDSFGKLSISNCQGWPYHQVLEQFQGYETSEEEPVEQPRRHDLYGFVDHPQLQQGYPMNEFAPHRLPQPKGNMNGWLIEDEEEVERNEVDSDLESTASSKPVWKKTNKADHDRASRNCPWCSK
ncbi:hypothetical protein Tco_1110174 [Tanacetum coccineum]|uniref:Uncharacterized protein n=1 Tax=Tanacetum coccineum TaxID=301880 RepID=A0ABQ5IIG8_9ASTR